MRGTSKALAKALILCAVLVYYFQIYDDYKDYWSKAPVPFHWFLGAQVPLLLIFAYLVSI